MHRAAPELSCLALLLALAAGGGCEKSEQRPTDSAELPSAQHSVQPSEQLPSEPPADAGRTTLGRYRSLPLTIVQISERSITVKPRFLFAGETQPSIQQTFAIDPQRTKVSAHVVTAEQPNEKGQVVQQTKFRPASLSDLSVGQVVFVRDNGDGIAREIIVNPPSPTVLPPEPPGN